MASYDVASKYLAGPVGRFDRTVSVERPDRQGRVDILGVHIGLRGIPLALDMVGRCRLTL
jgi:SpoVK/Ycf46/Vps4 family AAA+-type ATPase